MATPKIETIAQNYIRAKLAVEEADAALEIAKERLQTVLPEGEQYITKDGEKITHVAGTARCSFDPVRIKELVTPRIWKIVRIDAVDATKLKGLLASGEVSHDSIRDGVKTVQVRSSLRVTWPPMKISR